MKRELATKEIEVGKHLFVCLATQCSQDLGLGEPVINWACEYERSTTRHVAFVFYGAKNERIQIDAADLASLPSNAILKETLIRKLMQTFQNVLESTQ